MSIFTNEDTIADQPIAVTGTVTTTPSGTQDVNVTNSPLAVTIPTPVPVTDNAGSLTVDGSVSITGSVAVTGPLTDTQLRATPVPVSGTVTTSPSTSSTATVTQVVLTANTNATLLASNASRIGVVLFTPSQPVYVKFGTTASTTSFTYKLTANNSTLELGIGYTGRIDILSQNGQTVTVTEF